MTVTEPEFDVNERDNWEALHEYEDALCPQCGQLRSVCEDPNTDFYPQLHTCWATAAQTVSSRRFHDRHQKAKKDPAGYLPTDGRMVWISTDDLTPDDNFLADPPSGEPLADGDPEPLI